MTLKRGRGSRRCLVRSEILDGGKKRSNSSLTARSHKVNNPLHCHPKFRRRRVAVAATSMPGRGFFNDSLVALSPNQPSIVPPLSRRSSHILTLSLTRWLVAPGTTSQSITGRILHTVASKNGGDNFDHPADVDPAVFFRIDLVKTCTSWNSDHVSGFHPSQLQNSTPSLPTTTSIPKFSAPTLLPSSLRNSSNAMSPDPFSPLLPAPPVLATSLPD